MRAVSLSACLLLWAVALHGQAGYNTYDTSKTHDTSKLTWGAAPPAFPAGAKMAVVKGDPGKAEMFTVALVVPRRLQDPAAFPSHG